MSKTKPPSASAIDAKAKLYLAAQKAVKKLRDELTQLVSHVGVTPANAEKTLLLEGTAYALRLSKRIETRVDTASALLLKKKCSPAVFAKLFGRVDKFVLADRAHKSVGLVPGVAGDKLRAMFYGALRTKEIGSQLKVSERKKK